MNGDRPWQGYPRGGNPRNRRVGGFTLPEVVVTILLAVLLFSAIFGGLILATKMSRASDETLFAVQVMTERLDSLRHYSWGQITNSGFIPTTFTEQLGATVQGTHAGTVYRGTFEIGLVPTAENYSTSLREATVTLNWMSADGEAHMRTMSTFVSADGASALP